MQGNNNNHHHRNMPAATATIPTSAEWGWHRFATDYVSPYGYNFATVSDLDCQSWWMPSVTVYGGPQLSPMHTTTLCRWEVADFIRSALKRGQSVEVWDQTPTCLSAQRFAAGPCTPLTCAIGRPLRGAAPRFS